MRYIGVLVLLLAFSTSSARAEGSVDWSQYIESGPHQPLVKTTGTVKPAQAEKRVAKAKAPAKRKVKARAKKKTTRRR